ncbi:hypothetical protein KUCAC02_021876 [Chaenocephalus aceratus]|uniref:Uncharacterized protein n=1 Tax=Chaenocephalus aceratus TaxID=36190 RepID=A0ACB9XII3_CHAAC|nr:hypothetical protein KUCAC02_021876 [Chaenocephalus aceratus]
MPPVERLHLDHVVQTVSVLESVVLRSFGPEGGQVLFTRDTGQAMLSRSGARILTALRLEHPLARMVVECVLKHSTVTGDGSKTFILLLASLLRMIHKMACKEPNVSHTYTSRQTAEASTARHLADNILAFALEELDDLIAMGPKLLNAGQVLQLGCGEQWMEENSKNNRSIVQFSAWTERSLECVFANLQSLGVSVILSAVKQSAAVLSLAAQAEMCVVECVSENELSLFAQLSGATPVSDCWMVEPEHVATLTFCRPILLGAHRYVHVAFNDSEERVTVKPCSLVICGLGEGQTDQYTCAFRDAIRMLLSTWEPMGMTATTASKRTLQSTKSTYSHVDQIPNVPPFQQCGLQPGYVIPAGGTFEFLLHHALLQNGTSCSASDDTVTSGLAVSQLLANALLIVPRQIYSHSPRHFLQAQARFQTIIQNHSHPFSLIYKQEHRSIFGESAFPLEEDKLTKHRFIEADVSAKLFMSDSGLESVSCKYQLLLAVLQCLSSILHVDTVLHTHTALHTQSRRLANTSWEDTDDETED